MDPTSANPELLQQQLESQHGSAAREEERQQHWEGAREPSPGRNPRSRTIKGAVTPEHPCQHFQQQTAQLLAC